MTDQSRRPDASMDLLNQILRNPVDPEYARVARGGASARARAPWLMAAATGVLGALFAMAGVQTTERAPVAARERAQLVDQVRAGQTRLDEERAAIAGERARIDELRGRAATDESDRRVADQIETVGAAVGDVAVTGPGVVVLVDDAEGVRANRVLDRDIQSLVNGLWQSGAEAVTINDHRLTALTAIRGAGDSITVDYRSLARPYRIAAVGDPRTLADRWRATSGGRAWQVLHDRYGLRLEVTPAQDLRLPAASGRTLRHARRTP